MRKPSCQEEHFLPTFLSISLSPISLFASAFSPSSSFRSCTAMDKEPEELQSLTFLDIINEPFKLISRHSRLFASLTLTLILPLCFVMMLGHHLVTEPLIHRFHHNKEVLSEREGRGFTGKLQKELDMEKTRLLAFFVLYIAFVLAFSLLSTAAVVYSVACIYSGRRVSYTTVLKVVPRVWKRLLITFVWSFLFLFVYQLLGSICFVVGLILVVAGGLILALAVGFTHVLAASSNFLLFLYLIIAIPPFVTGFIYLSCIWHLASVISVMEESFGIAAMRKSFYLIRGMRLVGFFLLLIYFVFCILIGTAFNLLVVHSSAGTLPRVWYGILFILLSTVVNLFGMLVQTVFYFACKSQHLESIDKLALSEHLRVYLGEYVPLKNSIQMEPLEP